MMLLWPKLWAKRPATLAEIDRLSSPGDRPLYTQVKPLRFHRSKIHIRIKQLISIPINF